MGDVDRSGLLGRVQMTQGGSDIQHQCPLGPLTLTLTISTVVYCVSGVLVPWTTLEHARYILVPDQDHCPRGR